MPDPYLIEKVAERVIDDRQGLWGWAVALERWVLMAYPFDRGTVDENTPPPTAMPREVSVDLHFPEAERAAAAIIRYHRDRTQWMAFGAMDIGVDVTWLRWLAAMGWIIEADELLDLFVITEGFSNLAMLDDRFTRLSPASDDES